MHDGEAVVGWRQANAMPPHLSNLDSPSIISGGGLGARRGPSTPLRGRDLIGMWRPRSGSERAEWRGGAELCPRISQFHGSQCLGTLRESWARWGPLMGSYQPMADARVRLWDMIGGRGTEDGRGMARGADLEWRNGDVSGWRAHAGDWTGQNASRRKGTYFQCSYLVLMRPIFDAALGDIGGREEAVEEWKSGCMSPSPGSTRHPEQRILLDTTDPSLFSSK